jgi:hypothetical protein
MRPNRHGSVVKRGLGHTGPLYGVRWDDGGHSLEAAHRLRIAHGGAAHKNHSARGKRAWRHRKHGEHNNRSLGNEPMETSLGSLSESDWNALSSGWTMYGGSHYVSKLGKHWVVSDRVGRGFPLFETKRAAVAAVDELLGREWKHRTYLRHPNTYDTHRNRTNRNRALGVVGTATGSGGQRFRVSGRLELQKRRGKKVVERTEMPGEEFFGVPEDVEASPAKATTPRRRSGKGRLTKAAYLDAAEARGNIPPDQLVAFDAVWRSLWPTGLATLTERFMEWAEEHPSELAEYQMQYAGKRERELLRQERAQERTARKKVA